QEIDRRRCRARAVHGARVAEGLAIMSAFGMRLEIEQAHDLGGGKHDDLFVNSARFFVNGARLPFAGDIFTVPPRSARAARDDIWIKGAIHDEISYAVFCLKKKKTNLQALIDAE